MIDILLRLADWIAVGKPCIPPDGKPASRACQVQNIICFLMRLIVIGLVWYALRDAIANGWLEVLPLALLVD